MMGMDGGEQQGRCLCFLDSAATEAEEEGGGYIPTSTSVYLTYESDKFVMTNHW